MTKRKFKVPHTLVVVATHFDDVIAPPMDSLRETISSNV